MSDIPNDRPVIVPGTGVVVNAMEKVHVIVARDEKGSDISITMIVVDDENILHRWNLITITRQQIDQHIREWKTQQDQQ